MGDAAGCSSARKVLSFEHTWHFFRYGRKSLWLGLKFAHIQGVGGCVRSVVQFSLYFPAVEGFSVITFFSVYKPLSLIPQYLYFFLRARV